MMEISPEMVRDCIRDIIAGAAQGHIKIIGGRIKALDIAAIEKTATVLTEHCYSFAELPAPIFKEK